MKKFRQWLAERREIELYHGTTTGSNNEKLRSFKDRGIQPHSASGHGQGSGYYTFSDKNTVANHAASLTQSALSRGFITGDDTVSGSKHGGKPMVVAHKGMLNPVDYDMDHEVESKYALNFFKGHTNEINNALKVNPIYIPNSYDGQKTIPVYSFFCNPNSGFMGFWIIDPNAPNFNPQQAQNGEHYIGYRLGDKKMAIHGEEIGSILKELTNNNPTLQKLYQTFLRSVQKNITKRAGGPSEQKPNVAVKYIGNKPLTPSRILVKNDKWDQV